MMIALGQEWLCPLLCGAVFAALTLSLTPEGSTKRTVRFILGVFMTLLVLQPIRRMKTEWNAAWFSLEHLDTADFLQDTERISQQLTEAFIKKEAEAYIWNAADRLGIRDLGVCIGLQTEEGCPVPYEISLRGCWTEEQKTALTFLLEGELGIPRERQDWSSGNVFESEESSEGP